VTGRDAGEEDCIRQQQVNEERDRLLKKELGSQLQDEVRKGGSSVTPERKTREKKRDGIGKVIRGFVIIQGKKRDS